MSLVDVFLDPAKHFAGEKDKPTFLLPAAILIAASAVMVLAYFLRVDPAWYMDFMLTASGKEMTAAEMAQAKQFMPSASVQGYIGAGATAIVIPIVLSITALYYLLAGKVAGAGIGFKHGLALASWSSLPVVLGLVVGTIGAFTMAPQTPQHALMLTHVDPLFVQLPMDHDFSSLAKGFDLLSFWSIAIAAVGWKTFSRGSWGGAVFVAALPSVVIYGVWLLIALL